MMILNSDRFGFEFFLMVWVIELFFIGIFVVVEVLFIRDFEEEVVVREKF